MALLTHGYLKQEASRPNSSAFYLGICRTPIQNWKICLNSHERLTKSGIIWSCGSVIKTNGLHHRKSYLVIIGPNSDEKLIKSYFKLQSVRTFLKITRLASRKSYLLIIVRTWYEKLTKSVIRSSCSWFKHGSKSLIYPLGSRIWSLLAPIQMKGWSKVS